MSKYDELKKLAEAATPGPWSFDGSYICPARVEGETTYVETWHAVADSHQTENVRFIAAANPAAILDLLAENERNQRMLLAACMDMGSIGEALGADMNSDGEELLSMVVSMKAQNERLREFLLHISRTSGDKGAVMGARELLKEFGA